MSNLKIGCTFWNIFTLKERSRQVCGSAYFLILEYGFQVKESIYSGWQARAPCSTGREN